MGLDHRIKEPPDNFARCPGCGCVEEFDDGMPIDHLVKCGDCQDKYAPRSHLASWEDFTRYCQSIKGDTK